MKLNKHADQNKAIHIGWNKRADQNKAVQGGIFSQN